MKKTSTSFLILLYFFLFAQKTEATPVATTLPPQTRAVIVGISDYQDEKIPDLKYAHKDAEAFSSWLQSKTGGLVPSKNIQILTNEHATIAQFTNSIDWLLSETKEGDKVIIYFSGHGDMEAKILNQLGFLLLWDSPAKSYLAGALPVDILKQVITTLSIEKKANVLMIADACRAGKLAGNNIIGSQLTNNNLSKQFANEQKILSCQANEYSIEGKQWGDGRGAFSFHLINGLYGLADKNGDESVSLLEIERFVQDRVETEVAPLRQMPLTVGDKNVLITNQIDHSLLESLKLNNQKHQATFSNVAQRSLEEDVLAQADSSILKTYLAYSLAIQEKRFLKPANDCADLYFELLLQEKQIKSMHSYLLRNYAAALQDDAQQAVNAIISMNVEHISQSRIEFYEAYKGFPDLLSRAAELLGESHYFYSITKAKEFLFKGVLLYFESLTTLESQADKGKSIMAFYEQSIAHESRFPITHYFMSLCYAYHLDNIDSTFVHMEKATELSKSWIMPYTSIATVLIKKHKIFDRSSILISKATEKDSTNVLVWKSRALWHYYQNEIKASLQALDKALLYAPKDVYTYNMIGEINYLQKEYNKSKEAFLISIELDSNQYDPYFILGGINYSTHQFDKAEEMLLKAIHFDPSKENARLTLAFFYKGFEKYDLAILQMEELSNHSEPSFHSWFMLASLWAYKKDFTKAIHFLELALKNGYNNKKELDEADEFIPMRESDAYKKLIKTSFK